MFVTLSLFVLTKAQPQASTAFAKKKPTKKFARKSMGNLHPRATADRVLSSVRSVPNVETSDSEESVDEIQNCKNEKDDEIQFIGKVTVHFIFT